MKAFTLWKIRHCDEKREVRYLFVHEIVAFLFVYQQSLAIQAKNNSANKNEQKSGVWPRSGGNLCWGELKTDITLRVNVKRMAPRFAYVQARISHGVKYLFRFLAAPYSCWPNKPRYPQLYNCQGNVMRFRCCTSWPSSCEKEQQLLLTSTVIDAVLVSESKLLLSIAVEYFDCFWCW